MKMKLPLQPIEAAHFQFFHFIPTQTIPWGNREQKFIWLLETKYFTMEKEDIPEGRL